MVARVVTVRTTRAIIKRLGSHIRLGEVEHGEGIRLGGIRRLALITDRTHKPLPENGFQS